MGERYSITDFGQDLAASSQSGETTVIPRYGVWKVVNGVMEEVIETSSDFEELAEKYGFSEDDIISLKI